MQKRKLGKSGLEVLRLLPDLAETPEGRARIEKLIREIMAELSEEGIRYVSANED